MAARIESGAGGDCQRLWPDNGLFSQHTLIFQTATLSSTHAHAVFRPFDPPAEQALAASSKADQVFDSNSGRRSLTWTRE